MALITRVCVGMIITGIVAADLPDSELRGDDVPFILPKASGGSKADFIAQGIIARDSAMQSLENNDMADPRVAQRIKHFVDGMVELGVPLDQVLSGMLLPLQEVLRIRECDGKGPMCKDGSSSSEQLRAYLSLGKKQLAASKAAGRTPTYCETGFNAGHSAGVFLMLGFRVHSFDIAFNPYTRACAKNYEMIFPGQFVFHAGDSAKTVAAFASQEERCDVISVDGLHTYEMVVADIANFAHVAAPGNTLLVDDTSKAYMDGALQRAVDDQAKAGKAIKKGCVELVPRATMRRADVPNGWCVGSVVPTGGAQPVRRIRGGGLADASSCAQQHEAAKECVGKSHCGKISSMHECGRHIQHSVHEEDAPCRAKLYDLHTCKMSRLHVKADDAHPVIDAVMICYKRPDNVQRIIDSMMKSGTFHLIHVINHPPCDRTWTRHGVRQFSPGTNGGSIARHFYAVDHLVGTGVDWVYFQDDDLVVDTNAVTASIVQFGSASAVMGPDGVNVNAASATQGYGCKTCGVRSGVADVIKGRSHWLKLSTLVKSVAQVRKHPVVGCADSRMPEDDLIVSAQAARIEQLPNRAIPAGVTDLNTYGEGLYLRPGHYAGRDCTIVHFCAKNKAIAAGDMLGPQYLLRHCSPGIQAYVVP